MISASIFLQFKQHLNHLLIELMSTTHIQPTRLIVALSGGVDSIVLLHLLSQLNQENKQYSIVAHHVNHGLSEHANKWTRFCESLCESLGITLITSKVILDKKPRVSLEALARDARYQSFKQQMLEGDIILTAHHQDDQLETLLLALKRGSGSTGLQGIHQTQLFHCGFLLRPLLIFSRQQLVDYALNKELQWIEDESNRNIAFDRNFIRQKISPLLIERWPSIAQSVSRTALLCQEQQQLLNEIAEQDLLYCLIKPFTNKILSIKLLATLSKARRNNVLRHWLKVQKVPYPSYKQLDILWQQVALAGEDKQPQLTLLSGTIQRFQGALYFVKQQQKLILEEPIIWSGESLLWLKKDLLAIDCSKMDKCLLQPHQVIFCLRKHLPAGIKCTPKGRHKARSVKKLLSEYGVPPWLRDEVLFVLIDNQLIEAIGYWRCESKDLPPVPLSLHFV